MQPGAGEDPVSTALGIPTQVLDAVRDLGRVITGTETFRVADALLADTLYRAQCRRRIVFVEEVAAKLTAHGISPRVLPEGFALQAIEGGALADDPDVRRLWRNLLCNAVAEPSSVHPFVVDILRKLNGTDAQVLARVAHATRTRTDVPGTSFAVVGQAGEDGLLDALARLDAFGLLTPPWQGYDRSHLKSPEAALHAGLSACGEQFMRAVADPGSTDTAGA